MAWWKLISGKTIAEPVEAIGNVLDKLFTTDEERAQAQFVLERLRQRPQELQIELNKVEAQHRSTFVAGARPFILWVCGTALAFTFVINPILIWLTRQPGPQLQTDVLMELIVALLGLAGYRTVEKIKGVAK